MNRIPAIPHSGCLRLSFNQERFLANDELQRRQTGKPFPFNIAEGIVITGPLQVEILERCLNSIMARHAGLRAAFLATPGMTDQARGERIDKGCLTGIPPSGIYRQVILPEVSLSPNRVDLSSMEAAARSRQLHNQVRRQVHMPFDVGQAPLVRATLFRLGPDNHLLLIAVHHLISDMVSQRVMRSEIRRLYEALTTGAEPRLPELKIHYPDFADWQQERLPSADLGYWRQHWERAEQGQLSLRNFPFYLPPVSRRTPIPAYETITLNAALTAEIRTGARRSQVTLSVLFLASLGLILHRWTGRPVISIWNTFANRIDPDTLSMVGWLANSHLVSLDFSKDPLAGKALEGVRDTFFGVATHQETPCTLVWRNLPKAPQSTDLRVMFDFVEEERDVPVAGPVSFTRLPLRYLRSFRHPAGLEVLAIDHGKEISIMAGYFQDCFPALGVRCLLEGMARAASYLLSNDREARVSACPVAI